MYSKKIKGKLVFEINKVVAHLNLHIGTLGGGFRPAKQTLRSARRSGLNLNEYIESLATDERYHGQRNRVVERILTYINGEIDVLEIGSGTMRYSEYLASRSKINNYEIYETQKDWRDFAKVKPQLDVKSLIIQLPNGRDLNDTKAESVDLVHAHGVFVYLTFLATVEYLADASRVLRKDGVLVFDIFDIADLDQTSIKDWLKTPHRFPSFMSGPILIDMLEEFDLVLIDKFKEFWGPSKVTYFVLRKK
jgi:hypothetical protein